MISVIGRIVDENGLPLKNVKIVALADWFLTREHVTKPVPVDGDGQFVLQIENIDPTDLAAIAPVVPSFRVRVIDAVGRQLSEERVLDATVLNHNLSDITVLRAEAEGLLVTNKTGNAKFVSEGNAIKLLVDGEEAFGRVADEIKLANHSINMTQLFFSLPEKFDNDNETLDSKGEPKEKANLVFKFNEPKQIVPVEALPENLAKRPRIGDERPERLLLKSLLEKRTIVRMLMNEPSLSFPEAFFWLVVLTPLAAGIPVGGAVGIAALMGVGLPFFPLLLMTSVVLFFVEYIKIRKVLEETTDVDDLNRYFGPGITNEPVKRLAVRGFKQAAPDHGVQHCKMVIIDNDRAVVLGSPFSQRYWDTTVHQIEEPRRGGNTSDIVHDLSMAVVGPAARDLFETFRVYWNEDLQKDQELPGLPGNLEPNIQVSGEDAIAKIQVVRTMSGKRFKKGLTELNGESEKGILEGYLRAIGSARHYIYMENQYFTDGVITDALVAALTANSKLQVIMVVPIKPDVMFYPKRQAKRIEQIRKAGDARVGVFTRWSYDKRVGGGRPLVAPVYIHAKGAIVDDSWSTIGSANLDGLSLDYNLLLSPLAFGETTACELNLNVIPPSPGTVTKFAELMRRRLWAEHLGFLKDGVPDHDDPLLAHGPEHDWLAVWKKNAETALTHLRAAERKDLPGFILEYPKEDGGCLDTPRKHLAALGVKLKPINEEIIRPITGNRKFHFSTGKWDKRPLIEDVKL